MGRYHRRNLRQHHLIYAILGFLWLLILHYQIKMGKKLSSVPETEQTQSAPVDPKAQLLQQVKKAPKRDKRPNSFLEHYNNYQK